MCELLQIVFKQYCDSCESLGYSFFWNLIKDFILPIIIAGFAGYMVYWAFVKETRRDITNEQNRKDQERDDKLFYFAALINSCREIAKKQLGYVEEYIQQLDADKINLQPIKKVVWDDLKRTSQVLNLEEYLLAYVEYFKGDRKESVKEFKAIIGSIDLFHEMFVELKNMIERVLKSTYNEQLELQRIQNSCFLLLDKFYLHLFQFEKENYYELAKVMNPFVEKNGEALAKRNLEYFYNDFFIPLSEFSRKYIGISGSRFEHIFELYQYSRMGKELFETLRDEASLLRQAMANDVDTLKAHIEKIEANSKRLVDGF